MTIRNLLAAVTLLFLPAVATASDLPERPNILFIAIDDLRPDIGAYGNDLMVTPNLDRLAESGVMFERAYCQQALCAPSRTSLMSGLRPGIKGINATDSQNKANIRQAVNSVVSLPAHLRNNGYKTMAVGKLFHTYDTQGDNAWDEILRPGGGHYQLPQNQRREREWRESVEKDPQRRWRYQRGFASESADAPDENYQTHRIADRAIKLLNQHVDSGSDEPLFLGVGFYKPHLPFVAPQKYWDLYDRDAIKLPQRAEPEGVPEYALVPTWYEMRMYGDVPQGRRDLDDRKTKEFLHGYYACVSFVDAQIGRLMEEVETKGMADNTIVIVWSDHGFMLGDYGDWSKYTNMEIDTRVPLIVSGPGVASKNSRALVELIDLYPTVAEVAGVDVPDHVEGTSFLPLLTDPDREWKRGALSYYDRRNPDAEGFSLRTDRFRYTEWRDYETGEVVARELYDHSKGSIVQKNLADDPAYAEEVDRHAELLAGGWRGLVPQDLQ